MTKLDVVEFLLAFGPGILAFAVYGWFLWLFLFRKPDIRTLDIRVRRRLFVTAAFWPFAAFLPGVVILLFLAQGDFFPFALSILVSYLVGMLVLLPWYPRIPFIGRYFPDRENCVSMFRHSFPAAVVASFAVWTAVCVGISGGYLGEHFLEGGPRSPLRVLLEAVNGAPVYDAPAPYVRHSIQYPRHSFCLLCHLEQGYKHIEMRSEWRNVPTSREASDCGKIGFAEDCGNDIAGGE